jgi:hypothetical protein
MKVRTFVWSLFASVVCISSSSNAGWLSDLLENGKLPPLQDVGLCVIAPNLCIANEINKDQIRKKEIERENDLLRDRLVAYRKETDEFIHAIDIKSEQERQEISAALNEADECMLKATSLEVADNCILNLRREVFRVHRKFTASDSSKG